MTALIVILIALGATLATMTGGVLALKLEGKLPLVMGFSAGAVIGVAFFDLAPEALDAGVGLYAFVEADQVALEKQLRGELSSAKGVKPPEHIQVVHALPRDAAGKPRTEILQLVAMNQLDLIEPMMKNDADRAFLRDILESRKNLRDRFNFEAADMDMPSR